MKRTFSDLSDYEDFTKKIQHFDLIIKTIDGMLYFNKFILVRASKYFKDYVNSNMISTNDILGGGNSIIKNSIITLINLSDYSDYPNIHFIYLTNSTRVVNQVLNFICGNKLNLTTDDIYQLIPVADEFELDKLKILCTDFILENIKIYNKQELHKIFNITYKYKLNYLKTYLLNQLYLYAANIANTNFKQSLDVNEILLKNLDYHILEWDLPQFMVYDIIDAVKILWSSDNPVEIDELISLIPSEFFSKYYKSSKLLKYLDECKDNEMVKMRYRIMLDECIKEINLNVPKKYIIN